MSAYDKVLVMGGSWGGIQASIQVLQALPSGFKLPVVLVLHRLRNTESDLQRIYEKKTKLQVQEIEEKELLRPGCVHLAPANYHVLLERDNTFSLDVSDLENYSRPSIDVTFMSAADIFGKQVIGVLLSGASKDGSAGLKYIYDKGGQTIVQDPAEAEISTMPESAIKLVPGCSVMSLGRIQEYLLSIT
ncbi:chemotaxis protein CheB [Pontibacter qinzhouensis]|uniref:protein-glutamate methylesterase n=1 Tax=Pontibacter qinzhouensis TaxID=2603253 RepID=A0A5C8KCS2_9BACT|nr:chemotaxis protein CheB [Pontibacter qinzhouensis]TXK48753.1 chemotaxis protein CheB [Pontibacter qinzhouensis]